MKVRELLEILQNIDSTALEYDIKYSNYKKLDVEDNYFLEKEFEIYGAYIDTIKGEFCLANEELMEFVEFVNNPDNKLKNNNDE